MESSFAYFLEQLVLQHGFAPTNVSAMEADQNESVITLVFTDQQTHYYVVSLKGEHFSHYRGLRLALAAPADIEESLMSLFLSTNGQIVTGGLYKQGEPLALGTALNSWMIGSAIEAQPLASSVLTLYHVYPIYEQEVELAKQVGQLKLLQAIQKHTDALKREPIKMPGS